MYAERILAYCQQLQDHAQILDYIGFWAALHYISQQANIAGKTIGISFGVF